MHLTHKIALCPTPEQEEYFQRAAGTARFVWNWALAEWKKQYAAGLKPNEFMLRKQFNAIKYQMYPWLADMHRDSHSRAFTYLGRAWRRYFSDVKAGREAHAPLFKKKGQCRNSFYVANDLIRLTGKVVRLPRIGYVDMTESLRFEGKILGATISRTADRWFISINVNVPDVKALKNRTAHGVVGVDVGLRAVATISTGEIVASPQPLKAALRRLRIRGRRLSRQYERAKVQAGFHLGARLPKGTRVALSKNYEKASRALARIHARIANLRADFTHKLTTQLCRENQAVVIEDLHVKGLMANHKFARGLIDVGLGSIRSQLEYKAARYGTRLIVADRWYPSSRLCSCCGWTNQALALADREWTCHQCGAIHHRDHNAARNLQQLATVHALPVASPAGNGGPTSGTVPNVVGKVTPVRYECGHKTHRGRKRMCAHCHILDSSGRATTNPPHARSLKEAK